MVENKSTSMQGNSTRHDSIVLEMGDFVFKGVDMVEYASLTAHLALFAIIGVLIRHGLEVLAHAILFNDTDPKTALYLDLPTNMVGCFFMGWVGIVFKQDISMFSKPLGEGLSVGLMGSITTFATWNQRVIALATTGQWGAALFGYIIGMEVVQMSLLMGIESARMLKWISTRRLLTYNHHKEDKSMEHDSNQWHISGVVSLVVSLCLCILLWGGSIKLFLIEEREERRVLWVSCVVGPLGVWVRRLLASLNGKGVRYKLLWVPLGTLCSNLISVILESTISTISLTHMNEAKIVYIGKGLQFGLLGCLSTVSSLVGEIYTMYSQDMHLEAFAYGAGTLSLGSILGILLYAVPIWTLGSPRPSLTQL